ncbi:MAG: hypothetical protein OEY59_11145 [Deltaproteobacteria bacterium]|nr:hypothetical protein [Deltaproteobacteria bacterium]
MKPDITVTEVPEAIKEIMPGENVSYRLLTFIWLKRKIHWISSQVGIVKENIPIFMRIKEI